MGIFQLNILYGLTDQVLTIKPISVYKNGHPLGGHVLDKQLSVLPALCSDGIIALDISEGLVTKGQFMQFLKNDLLCIIPLLVAICLFPTQTPKLNPYPGVQSVVVMDNCAIHHDDEVRVIIEGECGKYLLALLFPNSNQLYRSQTHLSPPLFP